MGTVLGSQPTRCCLHVLQRSQQSHLTAHVPDLCNSVELSAKVCLLLSRSQAHSHSHGFVGFILGGQSTLCFVTGCMGDPSCCVQLPLFPLKTIMRPTRIVITISQDKLVCSYSVTQKHLLAASNVQAMDQNRQFRQFRRLLPLQHMSTPAPRYADNLRSPCQTHVIRWLCRKRHVRSRSHC